LEACLLVARSGHARNELVHHATQLDPGRVLAELDVAAAAAGDWGSDWPPQRSLLLLAAGQTAAALDIIDACLGDPSSPALLPPFWDALVRRAPQEAETRLRAQLDATEDEDSKLALGRSLAMALGSQGKKAEAVALLGDLLQTGLGDEALVNTFREVDPEALRSWLCKRVAAKPDAHALDLYGDALMAAKQSGDAVAAWWRAVELQPGSAAAYKLIQHVPAQAAARLAELARLRRDDELCGDIADALWQLGERRRAENLWRQASELDASDEEWANKLRRVWEGRNPLE
jgi:tetratricopeptide (TPR) repeat protein